MALSDPLIGKKLGDYTIKSLLGKGGMARVYQGYDENLDRYAAVKVISSEFAATVDELEYTERFQREARAIARLRHPHIVDIYQFGQGDGLYYMAMVFLDGDDLRTELRNYAGRGKRMPVSDVLRMAAQIADALDYAHSQGVIHRDIKPSNIMMTSRGAVLTDFGLALSTAEGTMGDTFGSAHYIAPEQAVSSARAVPQSDLYSLGVVLYEALAGKVPFDDPSAMSVALKHLNEAPPPLREINPELSPEIEQVIQKTLSKEPDDRYETGKELVHALYEAVGQVPIDIDSTVTDGKTLVEPAKKPKTGKLLKTATQEMQQVAQTAQESQPDTPLEAYLKSLREGSHAKRPSIAKNILTDIIKDRTSPKPPKEASGQKRGLDLDEVGTTQPEPPGDQDRKKELEKAAKPATASKRRSPILIMGVLILLVLVGGGAILVLSGLDNDDNGNNNGDSLAGNVDEETPTAAQTSLAATNEDTEGMTGTAEADLTLVSGVIATMTNTNTPTPNPTNTDTEAPPTETATLTVTRTRRPSATASPTVTEEEPTHTSTPTLEPTETSEPTATQTLPPSDTPTPESSPSSTPTATSGSDIPPDVAPEIRLEYDDVHLKLVNISGRSQNISNLIFEGDETGRFEAFDWSEQTSLGDNIFRFRDGGCLQIALSTNDVEPPDPDECRFHNFWLLRASTGSHFWRADAGNETFNVISVDVGEVIATCNIADGECEFALP